MAGQTGNLHLTRDAIAKAGRHHLVDPMGARVFGGCAGRIGDDLGQPRPLALFRSQTPCDIDPEGGIGGDMGIKRGQRLDTRRLQLQMSARVMRLQPPAPR